MSEAQCSEQYENHPTRPELVAVCTLPAGHDGPHSNLLVSRSKPVSATQDPS